MQTNHTPGPWTLEVTPTGWMLTADGADVTEDSFQCSDADARLIAAAPALLGALRELVQYVYDEFSSSHPLHQAADRARAAINRATGA